MTQQLNGQQVNNSKNSNIIRSKKEEKKWKKKMKEIGKNHPEFELSYDLLLGIRTSTSTVTSSVIYTQTQNADSSDRMQEDSDSDEDEIFEKEFRDSKRYSFPSSGSSQTPPHHMNDFEFKDYSRPIFAQLREWFGIKPQTYLVKLCGGFNLLEFISNSKSGQFFFYSHDGQFLIKSMTRSECRLMRKILPQYYYHVKNQPNTLLTKFYGMYRVKTHNRQPIYFIVMGSVFYTDLEIHKIYDLKGSTYGRKATEKEKKQDTPVLKDLDFIQNNEILQIGQEKAKLFCDQLKKDTQLLRKLKIMDYSLLVGLHYIDKKHNTYDEQEEKKQPLKINESYTDQSNEPNIEFSHDEQEEKKQEPPNILNPRQLHRVPSRRISQITTNIANRFTIKTPMEKNFDMPELVDYKRMQNRNNKYNNQYNKYNQNKIDENYMDDDDDDEFMNIFAKDNGGMHMTTDDGNLGKIIYFCGVIDILQKYNKRKKVENFFRGLNTDSTTISAVPPEQYSQRMYEFLKERIK